jgi:hypothetical protein
VFVRASVRAHTYVPNVRERVGDSHRGFGVLQQQRLHHTHTHTHTHTHACTRAHIHTHRHTSMHTHIHKHTYTNMYTHTHVPHVRKRVGGSNRGF